MTEEISSTLNRILQTPCEDSSPLCMYPDSGELAGTAGREGSIELFELPETLSSNFWSPTRTIRPPRSFGSTFR